MSKETFLLVNQIFNWWLMTNQEKMGTFFDRSNIYDNQRHYFHGYA